MTGEDIRQIRQRLAINQTQFAQLLGAHQVTVSNWERNVSEPTPYQASMIANFGRAAWKDEMIGKVAVRTMMGSGVGFAIYKLLEVIYGKDDEHDEDDDTLKPPLPASMLSKGTLNEYLPSNACSMPPNVDNQGSFCSGYLE